MILLSGPNISGNEWKYVKECLDTAWVSSVGAYVNKFEEMMAEFTGTKYAVATSSGTTALHISLMLAGVKRDDYVIVPNLTFIASVNSINYTGASPILMDVDENTWQMNAALLESFLQKQTEVINNECVFKKDKRVIRAIMPVHVLGNMMDMDKLISISQKFNLKIIEDATEALGSYYKNRHSGTFGLIGCFSYNGNKIITTGGGGMIVTNDEILAKKAKHLTTQAKADAFEYYHDEIGYNYRLVNVLAAMGVAQMEQLPSFLGRKKEIDEFYKKELCKKGDISFQEVKQDVKANLWLFTFRTKQQKKVLKALNDKGMQSRPFWVPMNRLPMFSSEVYISEKDVAGEIYSECLSIPCSTYIKDEELRSIANAIIDCY
jgi:aminotransferase in exopolysaccharide biosynthesis